MALPVCKRVTGLLNGVVGVSTALDCGESSQVCILYVITVRTIRHISSCILIN